MDDDDESGPDAFFCAEFGKGDLANRLWRGGLRASPDGYAVEKPVHALSESVSSGLEIVGSNKASLLVDTIETIWNDVQRMQRACEPLHGDFVADELNATSLVRVLLCVEPLQPPLARCIINKISEFGGDADHNGTLAPLLLSQLKWLDFIADSPALCESLLSIVQIVSPQMQRSIVESLPEILDDRTRDTAVTELMRILEENPAMMGSVVDALGALGVADDSVQDVNAVVLATLSAANRDMLPASLRYLMRTAPPVLFDATVSAMRSTLAHSGLGLGPGRLCLDALRSGFRISKNIADHAIKTLRKIDRAVDHRPADIWIILALLDSPANRKAAETLFRKKASANAFSFILLDAALAPFAESFADLHDRLICLAAITIKAPEPSARKTGVGLYALLFRLFTLGNARRNIVSSLLEHTGSRRPNEVDAALDALVQIARESEDSRSLLPHTASIQGLLDFLETFSDSQLRQIWALLALLCRSAIAKSKSSAGSKARGAATKSENVICDSENEDEDDDAEFFEEEGNQSELSMLEILIRKELTHVDMCYRRIGVLGACTMIKILGSHMRSNLFQMLFEAGRTQAFTQALAFDELANVLPQGEPIDKETIAHISEKISTSFEVTYLGDASLPEDDVEIDGMPASVLWANYDGPDVEVCIPVYRLIRKHSSTMKGPLDIIRPLAPGLRLLCVLTEMRDKGLLDEIDAVIGAPIRMPNITDASDFLRLEFPAKKSVLLSFFAAHGWVVELMNGFSGQSSPELRAKCLRRLENLIELEEMLSLCTARFPMWTAVLFDAYHNVESLQDHAVTTEKPGGRGRKSASASASEGQDGLANKSILWKGCARRLGPSALALLKVTSPITYTSTDFETEQVGDTIKTCKQTKELNAKSLHYLLCQLLQTIVQNIRQDVARGSGKSTPLSMVILQVGSAPAARKASGVGGGHLIGSSSRSSGKENPLDTLLQLKSAILALPAQLSRSLRRSMGEGDVDGDGDDYVAMKLFKESAIMCLKCLAGTLCTSNMQDASRQELLFDILASLRFGGEPSVLPSEPMTDSDIHIAAKSAFGNLRAKLVEISNDATHLDDIGEGEDGEVDKLGLEGTAAFLAVLETVYAYCSDLDRKALGARLSDVAGSVLERCWGEATMKSKRTLKLLPGIIRIYVQCSAEPMELVMELRKRLTAFLDRQKELKKKTVESQEIAEMNEGSMCKNWGSLTVHSYHAYCTAVFEQYILLFKSFRPATLESSEEAFNALVTFLTGTMPLFDLARNNEKVLGPAMRAGRAFVEQFIKSSLPFLKEKFASYRRIVLRILKLQQKFTRLLQVFCAHSKGLRDAGLTSLVPPLRRSLELLLYRVKEMLQSHDETGAYTLGNLKHRDINGDVVGSQDQYRSESENEMSDSDVDENEDGDASPTAAASSPVKPSKNKGKKRAVLLGSAKTAPPQKKVKQSATKNTSFSTTVHKPRSKSSKSSSPSKGSRISKPSVRFDPFATLPESAADDDEVELDDEDEDIPLVHSFDVPGREDGEDDNALEIEEDEETPIKRVKKRRKKKADSARSVRAKSKAVRALIDDEALGESEEEDEDEVDGDERLSGFLVDSQADD